MNFNGWTEVGSVPSVWWWLLLARPSHPDRDLEHYCPIQHRLESCSYEFPCYWWKLVRYCRNSCLVGESQAGSHLELLFSTCRLFRYCWVQWRSVCYHYRVFLSRCRLVCLHQICWWMGWALPGDSCFPMQVSTLSLVIVQVYLIPLGFLFLE